MGVPPLPRWRMVFVRCAKSSLREVIRNYVAGHSVSYVVPVPPAASIQTGRGYLAKLTTWLALLNGSSLPLLKQNQKKKKKHKSNLCPTLAPNTWNSSGADPASGSSIVWRLETKRSNKEGSETLRRLANQCIIIIIIIIIIIFSNWFFFPMFLFVATNRTCTCRQRHDASEWAPGIGKMFIYSRSLSTELLICWTRI